MSSSELYLQLRLQEAQNRGRELELLINGAASTSGLLPEQGTRLPAQLYYQNSNDSGICSMPTECTELNNPPISIIAQFTETKQQPSLGTPAELPETELEPSPNLSLETPAQLPETKPETPPNLSPETPAQSAEIEVDSLGPMNLNLARLENCTCTKKATECTLTENKPYKEVFKKSQESPTPLREDHSNNTNTDQND